MKMVSLLAPYKVSWTWDYAHPPYQPGGRSYSSSFFLHARCAVNGYPLRRVCVGHAEDVARWSSQLQAHPMYHLKRRHGCCISRHTMPIAGCSEAWIPHPSSKGNDKHKIKWNAPRLYPVREKFLVNTRFDDGTVRLKEGEEFARIAHSVQVKKVLVCPVVA
jgi:hypothetical protein